MTDQLSLLPMLDDAEHPTWLLNGKPAIQNDSGAYVDNVFRFREGKLSGVNIEVNLCAEGDYILFEFSYSVGTYGCGHPLCRPCHQCHRNNSAQQIRATKRAMWLARAYRGYDNSTLLPSKFMRKVWDSVERKCRAKAEEYK